MLVAPSPPQDYTDDLESLFYVYCHLIYDFEGPGIRKKEGSDLLRDWDFPDARLASVAKSGFCLDVTDMSCIPAYWDDALLEEFHEVIRGIVKQKDIIYASSHLDAEAKLKAYDAVAQNVDVYFVKVKAAFDKAITALEKEGPNAQEVAPYPTFFAAPDVASSASPDAGAPPGDQVSVPVVPVPPAEIPSCSTAPVVTKTSKKRPSEDQENNTSHKRPRDGMVLDILPSSTSR